MVLKIDSVSALSAIGGCVWEDENVDGIRDNDETGIPNVRLELRSALDELIAETLTDDDGNYFFQSIIPGTYVVLVDTRTMDDDLVANPTFDGDGCDTPHEIDVVVRGGDVHLTADFGYLHARTEINSFNSSVRNGEVFVL